eukprot:TRINITY_DN21296_c0_g3_i1.p1 TRINITY_DN21296_c0_g3~~TRINITY_DN21296_c0_g3_i1.p1  ORF type:complete len:248 (+),score=21.71 TRINITY_DN21296_c0_g3_i1:209-952(+)
MTAKQGTLSDLPANIRANVKRNLALDEGMTLRWLVDADCEAYLQEYYDAELLRIFEGEKQGMLRGDICRAAVLAREGGFYMDLDIQLNSPLSQLVDDTTTFASAFTMDGFVLNAILAVKPGCPVLTESLEQTKKLYRNELPHVGISMGTEAIFRALNVVVDRDCAGHELRPKSILQWDCGPHTLRFYEERRISCPPGGSAECPPIRAKSTFDGLMYGIFEPLQAQAAASNLVAWSRYEGCHAWFCGQ